AEEPEPVADASADGGGVLADAGGEDERVEPAEGDAHRADRAGDPVRVDVERDPGLPGVRALELLDRAGDAGEADEAGLALERALQRLDRGGSPAEEVQHGGRVDR